MSNLQLKIADRIVAKLQPSQYVNWTKIASIVGNTSDNYKVWGLMIEEGLLVQGYSRKSLNRQYVRIASNPVYKLV